MSYDNMKNITDSKQCSFTIDYILNHAGTAEKIINEQQCQNNFMNSTNVEFSWLHCTRFSPPKLQRQRRNVYSKVQVPVKRQLGRHPRIPFTSMQISILEKQFKETPYLSSEQVLHLSELLQLADIRIKIWFQNRRARERRDKNQLEENSSLSTSSKVNNCDLQNDVMNTDALTTFHCSYFKNKR